MPRYIKFKDNHADLIEASWKKMLREVNETYMLPPTKKKVCVDIGSNIGAFVHRAYTEGAFEEIYGFEPAFQTYHASLDILKSHGDLGPTVRVTNMAVTDNSGDILCLFDDDSGESGNASLVKPPLVRQVEHCPTISLDDIFDLLQIEHIDYLKMDCEGAEYNILKNSEKLSKISVMMLETHHDQTENIKALLEDAGFYVNYFAFKTGCIVSLAPILFAVDAKVYHEDYLEYYKWGANKEKKTIRMIQDDPRSPPLLDEYKACCRANE